MAVPKKRTSISKRGLRRGSFKLAMRGHSICSNCNEHKHPHHVCASCGMYNGKQLLAMKSKEEGQA